MLSGIEFAPLRFFLVGAAIIMCFQILTDTLLLINATIIKRELGCLGAILYGALHVLAVAMLGKVAACLLM